MKFCGFVSIPDQEPLRLLSLIWQVQNAPKELKTSLTIPLICLTDSRGQRAKESKYINTSLMHFDRVIRALRDAQKDPDNPHYIPFRDSVLTKLIQRFFEENGKAVCISGYYSNLTQCSQ